MKFLKYLRNIILFSKIFRIILFIVLLFIGFFFGIKYEEFVNKNTNLKKRCISLNSLSQSPKKIITPTSSYISEQKFNDLIWKKHINYDLKISFEYPENLGSYRKEALKVKDGKIILTHNMSYIFKVEKIITNDSVESWWDKNDSLKNNGNGILPAKMTKTKFHNKTAYYFEILVNQQVPSDFYIIPFNEYFLQISFIKIEPYRDALFSCINNNSNLCSMSDLYSKIDYDNYYRQFYDLIIQRILSSISFLL